MSAIKLDNLLPQLKAWFPPEAHRERELPGGGKWFFIPWQLIRKRLDEVCPDWTVTFSDPVVVADYIVVRCQLTLGGVTREGAGNDKAYPDKKTYGTPIERAIADAFKNAAEQFGVGAYLDDQMGDRQTFIQYMRSGGDNRAFAAAAQNGWVEGSLTIGTEREARTRDEQRRVRERHAVKISEQQRRQFYETALANGYTDSGFAELVKHWGYRSSRSIPASHYEEVLAEAQDSSRARYYNQRASKAS